MTLNLIVACEENGGIGFENTLPWPKLLSDMKWFKNHTMNNICIMGSNTWHSLPTSFKPLPNRVNVIFSSQRDVKYDSADVVLNGGRNAAAVSFLEKKYPKKDIYIIGGKTIYETWLEDVDMIHITRIKSSFKCDTFLDIKTLLKGSSLKYSKQANDRNIPYTMETYQCKST